MNVFMVAREYAGIAEAGGVKNVVCSLSEALQKEGCNVTVFMPFYACTDICKLKDYLDLSTELYIGAAQKKERISFSQGFINDVRIIFIKHPSFSQKKAVYTYTAEEEKENPLHKKGQGHDDSLFLNTLFQKAVIYAAKELELCKPQVIHCHDATAALIPSFMQEAKKTSDTLNDYYKEAKCLVTIHNAGPGYHHNFDSLEQAKFYTSLSEKTLLKGLSSKGRIEPFLMAAENAVLTSVSPWYAEEILNGTSDTDGLCEAFKNKNIDIKGITNGIDAERYDPENTEVSLLPFSFSPEKHNLKGKDQCRKYFFTEYASKDSVEKNKERGIKQYGFLQEADDCIPCICYHGRIAHQKGIDVASKAAKILLEKNLDICFIFAGQGSPELENEFALIAESFKGKALYLKGYTKEMARLTLAASDFSLHPSYFEPCGLEDFIAQLYGTLPVANATGGLKKILDEETGFLYSPNTAEKLAEVLYSLIKIRSIKGLNIFTSMISWTSGYVKSNYTWKSVVKNHYIPLYKSLLNQK